MRSTEAASQPHRVLGAAALLALVAAGCGRQQLSADERGARAAVARYNEVLVEAYRTGAIEPLGEVARPEEQARIASLVRTLAGNGKLMRARQVSARVLFVTVNSRPDGVTLVDTLEDWDYEHRALARPEEPSPVKRARYRLQYELVRRSGRFVVYQVVEHELPGAEAG